LPAPLSLDESLAHITLPSIPAIRSFANAAAIDVFLYLTPHKQRHLLAIVAAKLNDVFSRHKSNPMFSGIVSIVAHSLGSVICFDLLFQSPVGQPELAGRPRLNFQPLNLFALGSPIGVFSLFRDYHHLHLNPHPLGPCKLFNIFHPLDPVSFRLEPLMFNPYLPDPAPLPHHDSIETPTLAPKLDRLRELLDAGRVDFVTHFAPSSVEAVAPWVAALPAHASYWSSVDCSMFILVAAEYQEARVDLLSTAFGSRVMECVSSFLAGNNCDLDALMSDSLESASAAGERLLTELRSDPDITMHKAFEENFMKQLGLYCASRKDGTTALQLPMQPNLIRSFERMAVASISSILMHARMESIAGFDVQIAMHSAFDATFVITITTTVS
jgi:hypothetical protein